MTKAQQIAETLLGSSDTLDSVAEYYGIDENDLTQEQLEEIDEITLCCGECGWWVDADDIEEDDAGDSICGQCRDEREDHDAFEQDQFLEGLE